MNPVIKFLSKKVLAEKPGPRRQILCEFLIEEINQTLSVPEAIEPSFTNTTTPITDQQAGLKENEIITRAASGNPEEGSSSSIVRQTTLIVNRVHIDQDYSVIEEFQPITFLKYKNQLLPCKCDKKTLQQKAKEHFNWTTATRRMNYHCCKCKRPTTKMDTNDGWKWGYHQLCNSCTKNESYDITQESWYNSPCKVCDLPMTTKVNISWQNDVCSYICKYAYLSVVMANNFQHVPQKVKNYIETKNCSEDEGDVLKAAEAYYIKLHGQPAEIEYHQQYHTNETWVDTQERLQEEYDQLIERTADFFHDYQEYSIEQEYIDRMNQAFHDHREAIVEKLPKLLNLRKHHRHQNDQINLCHSCLCPYLNSELITIGKRILWTYIKGQNENPCYKEQWDEDNKENNQPDEIDEYLHRRNKDYQERFLVYLDRNMQRLKETSLPYE
ncbi:5543_t:CDS:1, partial [Entrophospora sp. SA101]